MNYDKYMEMAIDEAKRGILLGEQPYGAVLLSEDKVLAISHNETFSSHNSLNHAEIVALKKYQETCNEKSDDLTLVTTCEPCPVCAIAAIKAGVKRFVYGSNLSKAIFYGSGDINLGLSDLNLPNVEILKNILEKDCDNILEYFWLKNNIVQYNYGTDEEQMWMEKALEVGKNGMKEKDELPIGVLLVAGNELLTSSSTMTYTLNSPITHGDFWAIFEAKRKVYSKDVERPLVLYSTLEPHLIGFAASIKAHVDKVVFGLEADSDGGACYLPYIVGVKERLPLVIGGVLRDEQYCLMKEFLDTHEERRVGYDYAKKLVKAYEEKRR